MFTYHLLNPGINQRLAGHLVRQSHPVLFARRISNDTARDCNAVMEDRFAGSWLQPAVWPFI